MWASSACETRRCFRGDLYIVHHTRTQTNPNAPVATKAHCQPYATVSHGTVRGATTAPTFVPELKMPVANARSFLGNHSATVLMEAGKPPASPNPRAKRAALKPMTERASEWPIAAKLQTMTASDSPFRAPSRSMSLPDTNNPMAYASWNAKTMLA